MIEPSRYRRDASRIDRLWIPYAYITEAGNALRSPVHTAEFRRIADETTLILYRLTLGIRNDD